MTLVLISTYDRRAAKKNEYIYHPGNCTNAERIQGTPKGKQVPLESLDAKWRPCETCTSNKDGVDLTNITEWDHVYTGKWSATDRRYHGLRDCVELVRRMNGGSPVARRWGAVKCMKLPPCQSCISKEPRE